ncbi:MAG: spore maturation protein [Clostridiales bacterium]|nr:spore maturation protein [Clostridiales bacterium]
MKYLSLIVPLIFLLSFVFALCRKVKVYDSFTEGVKGAIPLIVSIFPYIAGVAMLTKLLEASGLSLVITRWITPLFNRLGIPSEIAPLLFMKPLSGSGSISVITDILDTYGVDSYVARCACVAYGSSETIFYIGAVYFAGIKRKKLTLALLIALISYFLSVVLCCFLCRIL